MYETQFLPERPLDPPDGTEIEYATEQAGIAINREAREREFWADRIESRDVDGDALADALHAAHLGHIEVALDLLRRVAAAALQAQIAREAEEIVADMEEPDPDYAREEQAERWEAMREDHRDFLEDR